MNRSRRFYLLLICWSIGISAAQSQSLSGAVNAAGSEPLAGQRAGVKLTSGKGTPGTEVCLRIRCRGSLTQAASPLYVVDGIQLENALSVISPQDIASIDVVTGAAFAATYGPRGANGVVLITTRFATLKKGQTAAVLGPQRALELYPNPATTQCVLVHPAASREASISVYSSLGQRVATVACLSGTQQTALDLHGLATGQYLVRYDGPGGALTVKLLHQ